MMAFEHKDNTGSVFVNDHKVEERHPDRTGSALIDGTAYWVHGWLKKTADGKPYLKLSFRPKATSAADNSKSRDEETSDFVPF
jgi:hypothetical protein